MPAWYEELFDQRYLEFYGDLHQHGPACEDAEFADRALGLQRGARVLDLGCGFGRHAVALAQLGHRVTGIDLSETLLGHAARLAADHRVPLELVHRDMRQLQGLGPYDACVCLYTVLGYFDDDENAAVLRAVHELLGPRGALLLDVTNPLGLLGHLSGEKWREVPAGIARERAEYDPLTGRLRAERVLYRSDGRREPIPTSLVRLYAPYELKHLLELAGFETEQLHGGLRDELFDWRRSQRQVWVLGDGQRQRTQLGCCGHAHGRSPRRLSVAWAVRPACLASEARASASCRAEPDWAMVGHGPSTASLRSRPAGLGARRMRGVGIPGPARCRRR